MTHPNTPEPNLPKHDAVETKAAYDFLVQKSEEMAMFAGPPAPQPDATYQAAWDAYVEASMYPEVRTFDCIKRAVDAAFYATPTPDTSAGELFSFFGETVDRWGAAKWFDRLAKAVREQDKAVIAKDDVGLEICQNVVASSAMRLVRDYEQQVRTALDPPSSAGERMREALEGAIRLAQPATGKDVLTNAYERGRFDGVMEYAQNLKRTLAAISLQGPSGKTGGEG